MKTAFTIFLFLVGFAIGQVIVKAYRTTNTVTETAPGVVQPPIADLG